MFLLYWYQCASETYSEYWDSMYATFLIIQVHIPESVKCYVLCYVIKKTYKLTVVFLYYVFIQQCLHLNQNVNNRHSNEKNVGPVKILQDQ